MNAHVDRWDYAALAIVASWPLALVVGLMLLIVGNPWAWLFLGYCSTAWFGSGRLALHFYRHGLDNHLCHRSCCRFDR